MGHFYRKLALPLKNTNLKGIAASIYIYNMHELHKGGTLVFTPRFLLEQGLSGEGHEQAAYH